jgi:hypothetical protein
MGTEDLRTALERSVGGQFVAAVVILGLAGSVLATRDPSTPVAVDSAVERFRSPSPVPDEASGAARRDAVDPSSAGRAPSGPSADDPPAATPPGAATSDTAAPTEPSPSTGPGTSADGSATTSAPKQPTPSASASTGAPDPQRPDEGVYVYATDGHDEVDALGGRRHDYPAETTVSLRWTNCGVDTRWDVLEERWDEASVCSEGGDRILRALTSYREFLGHGERQEVSCEVVSLPADAAPGSTSTGSCSGPSIEVSIRTTVVERGTVTIAGTRVPSVHVRSEATFSGDTDGSQVSDRWYHPETGLELRGRTVTDVDRDSHAGRVHYQERYDRRLTSLQPRR